MKRLNPRRQCAFTLIELLVIVVVLVVFFGAFVPACVRRQHEGSGRISCSGNLRQIGQALLLYSNENKGCYPRTIYMPGNPTVPAFGTGVAASNPFSENGPRDNDVTAALFLLLRTQDITSEVFICPSTNDDKDDFGGGTNTALNRSNFTDVKKNLSYSMLNPYPDEGAIDPRRDPPWWTNAMTAEYPLAADKNPGTSGGDDNVLGVSATSNARQMRTANSNNHEGEGQCVLYADGHVEWQQNPFCGIKRDNIFTRAKAPPATADPGTAGGNSDANNPFGGPLDANDSVLLPTDD